MSINGIPTRTHHHMCLQPRVIASPTICLLFGAAAAAVCELERRAKTGQPMTEAMKYDYLVPSISIKDQGSRALQNELPHRKHIVIT